LCVKGLTYLANKVDEIQRAYLIAGPCQPYLSESSYPFSKEKHSRRFQSSWFKEFSSWLEYSPHIDVDFVYHVIFALQSQVGDMVEMHSQSKVLIVGREFIMERIVLF